MVRDLIPLQSASFKLVTIWGELLNTRTNQWIYSKQKTDRAIKCEQSKENKEEGTLSSKSMWPKLGVTPKA